jgi:hypothetical protein
MFAVSSLLLWQFWWQKVVLNIETRVPRQQNLCQKPAQKVTLLLGQKDSLTKTVNLHCIGMFESIAYRTDHYTLASLAFRVETDHSIRLQECFSGTVNTPQR